MSPELWTTVGIVLAAAITAIGSVWVTRDKRVDEIEATQEAMKAELKSVGEKVDANRAATKEDINRVEGKVDMLLAHFTEKGLKGHGNS